MKKNTISKFKAQTDPIPLLSSEGNTEVKAELLPQSLGFTTVSDPTRTMITTPKQLRPILKVGINEQARAGAVMLVPLLSILEKNGLIRRFKLLSKENQVTAIEVVFEMDKWTENLELREFTTVIETVANPSHDKE